MARDEIKKFVRKRPPIFWWILANLLAAAFAITSWVTCLYIFNFPEKPSNYGLLRKLKRLQPVRSFTPSESPEGDPATPKIAFKRFFPVEPKTLEALNIQLKRNFITNYKDGKYIVYIEGDYRITHVRNLAATDFFHPGVAIRAQAFVQPDEVNELTKPADYPVVVELLLPLDKAREKPLYKIGDLLSFNMAEHRTAVLHIGRIGSTEEPLICLTAVPLAYEHHRGPTGDPLPLAAPDPLNLVAPFPVMKEDRR